MTAGRITITKEKGYGFMEVAGYDNPVFFHASALQGVKFEALGPGDDVTVRTIMETPKGYVAQGIALMTD